MNPWRVWSPTRGIERYPISYVAEGTRIAANNEIIRLDESVRSLAYEFSRCRRARVSLDSPIFLDDTGPGTAREQIFDVIFLPALCPFVRPLVESTSWTSLRPANFLFSLPHFPRVRPLSCFQRNVYSLVTYYVPFVIYHFLMRIDFLNGCRLLSNFANLSFRVSFLVEAFLSLSLILSVILFTEIFHHEITVQCNIWFIYLTCPWLLCSLLFCTFAFTSSFPEFSW